MPWRSRGVTPGRTWVYAPSPEILKLRWREVMAANDMIRRTLFAESADRTLDTRVSPLPGFNVSERPISEEDGDCPEPVQVAYRSFDRQWIIPDNRLMARARPPLWQVRSREQIYVSVQDAHQITTGPGLVFTALIPDLHHFCGWGGGGVRPLWRDSNATIPNISPGIIDFLSRRLEAPVASLDLLAYIAAVTAHPGFTARFKSDLKQRTVRVPLTAMHSLWTQAVSIGHEIIWLHTFGTRCVDAVAGRRRGERALIERYGIRCPTAVIALPERIPDRLEYRADSATLCVGQGTLTPVAQEVLDYDVGGRRILWRWLNDRTIQPRNKRRSSRLDDIGVNSWTRRFTDELLALLSVLTGCTQLHPAQATLLDRICDNELISVAELHDVGVLPVAPVHRLPPANDEATAALFGPADD